MSKLGKRSMRNLSSAGWQSAKFTVGTADKAAGGIHRLDYTGRFHEAESAGVGDSPAVFLLRSMRQGSIIPSPPPA